MVQVTVGVIWKQLFMIILLYLNFIYLCLFLSVTLSVVDFGMRFNGPRRFSVQKVKYTRQFCSHFWFLVVACLYFDLFEQVLEDAAFGAKRRHSYRVVAATRECHGK